MMIIRISIITIITITVTVLPSIVETFAPTSVLLSTSTSTSTSTLSLSHYQSNDNLPQQKQQIYSIHHGFRIRQRYQQHNTGTSSQLFMSSSNSNNNNNNNNFNNNNNNNNQRGLLQILNDEVSELLLERLSQKLNGNNNNNNSNNNPSSKSKKNEKKRNLLSSKTTDGLSKFHRNMLASTTTRQRCVSGKYPLHITITENPTRKWLSSSNKNNNNNNRNNNNNNNRNNNNSFSSPFGTSPLSSRFSSSSAASSFSSSSTITSTATSQMLVNGTSVDKSLASFDRYQWLDEDEQQILHYDHTLMSIELVAEIHVKKPGYVNILSCDSAGLLAERRCQGEGDNNYISSTNMNMNMNNNMNNNNFMNRYNNSNKQQEQDEQLQNQKFLDQQQQEKERMWITGFSITKQSGELHYVDIENGRMGSVMKTTASSIRWPNEVNTVPKEKSISSLNTQKVDVDAVVDTNTGVDAEVEPPLEKHNDHGHGHGHVDSHEDVNIYNNQNDQSATSATFTTASTSTPTPTQEMYEDALLVSDGFLVPGKDNGGLYIISNPGHETLERNICLTGGNGVDRLLTKLENRKRGNYNANSSIDPVDTNRNNDENSTTTASATTIPTQVADDDDGWFYHRSVWIDLTNDGRQSILTARAKRPSILKKADSGSNNYGSNGGSFSSSQSQNDNNDDTNSIASMPTKAQLVWLERPKPYCYDNATGTPLDKDGLVFDPFAPAHTPWKVRILDEGPDVMFSVADLDTTDDTIEIFASQFFNKKLTLHSIKCGDDPRVVWKRIIDDRCGASFSSILANLDMNHDSPTRKVIDCGSTIPTLKRGDGFSHLLVTSHECTFAEVDEKQDTNNLFGKFDKNDNDLYDTPNEVRLGRDEDAVTSSSPKTTTIDGGSLFSYRVPSGKDGWRTKPWIRSVIATGFRVRGQLGNMINPGAPGFCYTFYPTKDGPKKKNNGSLSRPLIAIAGDCAESAYILRPLHKKDGEDPSANYAMMCEIECGATVGSIGVGYEDFCFTPQQSGYAKIYIPCYEKDKVLVFALGNGEDDDPNDGW